MSKTTPVVHNRLDYQAPDFTIETVYLTFNLGEKCTEVQAIFNVRRLNTEANDLVLDGDDLKLKSVAVNGEPLSEKAYKATPQKLTVKAVPENFCLTVVTEIYPQKNTKLMGLYCSGGNFCTQCESEGFRRITYFLDRPDVLATYKTKIIANKERYPVLLANGNLIEEGEAKANCHYAVWEDPFKKPSYLFAMVAGDLACLEDTFVTMTGRMVKLKIFAAHDKIDQCDFAMLSLKKAMRWDEDVYGREYDLDIFMIVAVNDFNFGAMENKGLNVFNDRYILASEKTATDSDYFAIEAVVAHEYFHNWSGNRVTVRDWFQLSLKEGLTVFRDHSFSQDMGNKDVVRIQAVKRLRSLQFPEDAGPLAHPIRPDSYIEMSNFYTATVYEKGAEVIGMLKTILGDENYRSGTDYYFEENDGKAVTCDDFVTAMEKAGRIDLSQFKLWYSQAGTPEVTVQQHFDSTENTVVYTFYQSIPDTPGQKNKKPMMIPIKAALFNRHGTKLSEERTVYLRDEVFHVELDSIPSDVVPSLLRGFSAPVKLNFDYADEDLEVLIRHDDDGFARFEAMQIYLRRVLLKLVSAYQKDEKLKVPACVFEVFEDLLKDKKTDPGLLAELLALPAEDYLASFVKPVDVKAIHVARHHLKEALATKLEKLWQRCYDKHHVTGAYEYTAQAVGERSLKNVALSYLVALGKAGAHLAYHQFEKANNMTDQFAALVTLSHTKTPERKKALAEFYDAFESDTLVMDKWFAVQAAADLPDAYEQVVELMKHPLFTLENPNKVRAVMGSFSKLNPVYFHTEQGYSLLRDVVIKLDKINPMVAARIVQPLTAWKEYSEKEQRLMKDALSQILKQEGLSKDVYEIVSKGLS